MTTPVEIVTGFLAEWAKSAQAMRASFRHCFTSETVWENVGMATTTGIDQAVALLDQFESGYGVATIAVDMLNIAAAGNVVMTERVDRLIASDGKEILAIRLMGVFELEDGRIVRWRDYFDTAAIAAPAPAK